MPDSQFNPDQGSNFSRHRKTDSIDKVEYLPEEVKKAMALAKAEEHGLVKDTSKIVNNMDNLRKRWRK